MDFICLKSRTIRVYSSDSLCNDSDARFPSVALKPKSDKKYGWKMFDSDNFSMFFINKKCASHFCRETTNESNDLNIEKYWYLIHTWSENAFKTGDTDSIRKNKLLKNRTYI